MKKILALVLVVSMMLGVTSLALAQGPSGELELFSWWAGDEGPALEALIAYYNELYPDVEVINATVTGGSGVNARAVLKTRMLGGDPPGSFQVHAGQELIGTWVVADRMEDLTFLFEEEGWTEKYPAGLLELLSTEDGIWSVPVNIHRSNVLWFVPANLEEWGVEVPADWTVFVEETCPMLQENDIVPLALGENWTVNHLWESVMLDAMGVDGWNGLWDGSVAFDSEEAVAGWDLFGAVLGCTNEDAASLSWQQATDMVVGGSAAFNVMGDWAAGYMTTTLELEPGVDYGYAAAPGTDGVFMALSDSFGLPADAPNRDAVVSWLRTIGSAEGQDVFNPLKGSIPAHLDGDVMNVDLYNAYLQSAAADWGSDVVVGSLVHGATAPETFSSEFSTVMELFLATGDAAAAGADAQAIAIDTGVYVEME